MPIVAYGYGLDAIIAVLTDDVILTLDAEPDITVDDEVTITLEPDSVAITLDPEIDIEVD